MVLQFLPVLTDEENALYVSLPKFNGHVVNPRYITAGHRDLPDYECRLKVWCDARSPAVWPQWVYEWHRDFEFRQAAEGRRAGEPVVRSDAGQRVAAG